MKKILIAVIIMCLVGAGIGGWYIYQSGKVFDQRVFLPSGYNPSNIPLVYEKKGQYYVHYQGGESEKIADTFAKYVMGNTPSVDMRFHFQVSLDGNVVYFPENYTPGKKTFDLYVKEKDKSRRKVSEQFLGASLKTTMDGKNILFMTGSQEKDIYQSQKANLCYSNDFGKTVKTLKMNISPIEIPAYQDNYVLSQDGKYVLYIDGGKLFRISTEGENRELDQNVILPLSISNDGNIVAYAKKGSNHVLDLSTGEKKDYSERTFIYTNISGDQLIISEYQEAEKNKVFIKTNHQMTEMIDEQVGELAVKMINQIGGAYICDVQNLTDMVLYVKSGSNASEDLIAFNRSSKTKETILKNRPIGSIKVGINPQYSHCYIMDGSRIYFSKWNVKEVSNKKLISETDAGFFQGVQIGGENVFFISNDNKKSMMVYQGANNKIQKLADSVDGYKVDINGQNTLYWTGNEIYHRGLSGNKELFYSMNQDEKSDSISNRVYTWDFQRLYFYSNKANKLSVKEGLREARMLDTDVVCVYWTMFYGL